MIGIKCDGCNNMHQTDLLTHRYADSIPDDWVTLYRGKPDTVEKTSHFCSLPCLNRWLVPQLIAKHGEEAVKEPITQKEGD